MKKWLILLLVLSTALVGCTQADDTQKEADKPAVAEKIYPVKVDSIGEASFINTIQLSGILTPVSEAYVSAQTSGEVQWIGVRLGDAVKKEDLLMSLDDQAYKLGLSKAALGVDNASTAYKNANSLFNSSKALYDSGGLSQTELDQGRLQRDLAELGLKNAKLDLASAQMNIDNTKILAPISGLVAEQVGAVGENVGPGQKLFRIVDISSFYLELGVSEHAVNRLNKGQLVVCQVPGEAGSVSGIVEQVSPVMSEDTKTYPVKIRIDSELESLRIGMSLSATIALDQPETALAVLKESVLVTGDKRIVYVVEEGRAIEREVQIGGSNDNCFQVVSGLKAGEQVVTSGPGLLKSGVKVNIQ